MAKESLEQKRYWLNKQLNGAAAFIGVAVFFVGLRLLATLVRRPRQNLFGWNDVLIVSALFAFVAVCACAIGEDTSVRTKMSESPTYLGQLMLAHIWHTTTRKAKQCSASILSPSISPLMASVSCIP